jgi:ORF6N domain
MTKAIAATDRIQDAIRLYRGQKVLLDFDLAALYGVTTFNLNKAVARNKNRFPPDFMLSIPAPEVERLIFQTGISKPGRGGRRKPVLAFTQEGVAMVKEKRTAYRVRTKG